LPRNPIQLYDTAEQKADLEARNGLLQSDEVRKMLAASRSVFKLVPPFCFGSNIWQFTTFITAPENFAEAVETQVGYTPSSAVTGGHLAPWHT